MLPKTVTLKLSGDDAVMFNNAVKGYARLVKANRDGNVVETTLQNVIYSNGNNAIELTRISMYIDTVIKAEAK